MRMLILLVVVFGLVTVGSVFANAESDQKHEVFQLKCSTADAYCEPVT